MAKVSADCPVSCINPLEDPRWDDLLQRHRDASVFHTTGWLQALKHTYGFDPVAYTTASPADALEDGLVFCHVDSWLTGRRMVSLPFSDHCRLLARDSTTLARLLNFVRSERRRTNQKFIEIRPFSLDPAVLGIAPHLRPYETFCFQKIDLSQSIDLIFRGFHKSERNAVRRAEREGLICESGRSDELLQKFYRLFTVTRRRHGMPPQPFEWFRNLINCLGRQVTIRTASKDKVVAAAILTLSFKNTVTYKYACSDRRFNSLGAMPFLCWKTIEASKAEGATEFDLGRSNPTNKGLIDFKSRLGADSVELTYFRDELKRQASLMPLQPRAASAFYKSLMPLLPERLFVRAGAMLYRHVG